MVEGQRDTYTLPYLQQAGGIVQVPEEEKIARHLA